MNRNPSRTIQINVSGIGFWITLIAVIWLLGSLGLGWLVKSIFIVLILILLAPIVAFLGFRWWLQRNIIEAPCPVCQYEFMGLKNTETRCPSCGEPLRVERDAFERLTPPGTVDVDVVDVSPKELSD